MRGRECPTGENRVWRAGCSGQAPSWRASFAKSSLGPLHSSSAVFFITAKTAKAIKRTSLADQLARRTEGPSQSVTIGHRSRPAPRAAGETSQDSMESRSVLERTHALAGSVSQRCQLRREPSGNSVGGNSEIGTDADANRITAEVGVPHGPERASPRPALHDEREQSTASGVHSPLRPKANVPVTLVFASLSLCCKAGVRAGIAGG